MKIFKFAYHMHGGFSDKGKTAILVVTGELRQTGPAIDGECPYSLKVSIDQADDMRVINSNFKANESASPEEMLGYIFATYPESNPKPEQKAIDA